MADVSRRGRWNRWWPLAIAAVVLAVAGAATAAFTGGSSAATAIGAFPAPGTQSAAPRTEISFRGAPASELGAIEVVGSRSGAHAGELRAHSDGRGASFVPAKPLQGGETVTVRSGLNITGARDGDFTFTTVARPREGLGSGGAAYSPSILRQLTAQQGKPPAGAVARYRTAPGVRPPEIQVRKRGKGLAPGLIFISPKKVFGAKKRPGLQSGPLIVDNDGEPVWFAALDKGNVTDFRVQEYRGKPVLTWWQGRQVLGTGEGQIQIADSSYRPVKRVRAANGYRLDFHETTITPRGTLLGLVYNPVNHDLSSVGGPRDGRVVDSVVQEIDIATGRVLFEWHSLGNVALTETYGRVPKGKRPLFDYFHANSVDVDSDGNLLVSGRETWSVVKLDRHTGRIMWRLGGKKSDFKLPRSARFAWQHDARRERDGTIRIFDNEAAPKVRDRSRVVNLALDEQRRTATLKRSYEHPERLLAGTQGNGEVLPNGNVFVGWGSQGYFSEFSSSGKLLYDARIARGNDTYRAYRIPWKATPRGAPAVVAESAGAGRVTVYASWNGATEVARWEVLAGDRAGALHPVESAQRDGFETRIPVETSRRYVAVRAKDRSGRALETSKAVQPER